MAHSMKIVGVNTMYSQVALKDVLQVTVEVTDGEISKGNLVFGYELLTTEQAILQDLKNVAASLDNDDRIAAESAANAAALEGAQTLKDNLMDAVITGEKN